MRAPSLPADDAAPDEGALGAPVAADVAAEAEAELAGAGVRGWDELCRGAAALPFAGEAVAAGLAGAAPLFGAGGGACCAGCAAEAAPAASMTPTTV